MTEEHLWLQGHIRQLCEELGCQAALETDYADIKVEGKSTWAVEVQRVSTDYAKREEQRAERRMKTLWLLPESAQRTRDSGRRQGGDPVFSSPAVRLLYRFAGNPSLAPDVKYLRENVWTGRRPDTVVLRVAATLWTLSPDGEYLRRHEMPMPLRAFLAEIFEGKRVWLSRGQLVQYTEDGDGWAGWVRDRDCQRARAADLARRERRAVAMQKARETERLQILQREQQERQAQEADEQRRAAMHVNTEEVTNRPDAIGDLGTTQDDQVLPFEEKPFLSEAVEDRTELAEVNKSTSPTRELRMDDESGVRRPWWKRLWRAIVR